MAVTSPGFTQPESSLKAGRTLIAPGRGKLRKDGRREGREGREKRGSERERRSKGGREREKETRQGKGGREGDREMGEREKTNDGP